MLPASSVASFDSEMATLADDEATIIVLLVDGFDPAIVRAIFTQVRSLAVLLAVLCIIVCVLLLNLNTFLVAQSGRVMLLISHSLLRYWHWSSE